MVRHALQEYVARQTGQPSSAYETAVTLAAMAARFDGLQDQVEALATRLESLATSTRQTLADMSASERQPRSRRRQPPDATSKFVLGSLCPRGHAYQDTGQTLRRRRSHSCPACEVEQQRARRQAQQQRGVAGEHT